MCINLVGGRNVMPHHCKMPDVRSDSKYRYSIESGFYTQQVLVSYIVRHYIVLYTRFKHIKTDRAVPRETAHSHKENQFTLF